jgi:ABC-type sugar transport system substrate-binding protein
MMDRRIFLTTVAGLLAAPLAAEAQQAGKVYRIAFVSPGPGPCGRSFDALRQGLREQQLIEEGRFQVECRQRRTRRAGR